jgi:glycosyltransferase involved in cell wall biosynthesis
MRPLLSIIVPCFNEEKTIKKIIKKILQIKNIHKQIIIVNDGSTDNSLKLINTFKSKVDTIINHKFNRGKGFCIRSAKKKIKGNIVLIQDSDLEYNPKDYKKLIDPIMKKKCDIVYGSRVLHKNRLENIENFSHWFRIFANFVLTFLNNIINNQSLTDAHTCYKVFKSKIFKRIILKENDFSFCPEITTKISNLGYKIFEVPISYNGRKYSEGKKIKLKDGFKAIYVLLKYKFFK